MRSKGSRFTLGVWGLRVCSLEVLSNRPQPFATVRSCSRDPRMAVPMVSSAEGVILGGFKHRVASFRVAGVALRDVQTCFVTCRKSFCAAGAILARRFRKMSCSFRGRRSTLDVSIVILRGRHSTLDVSCCAASSGDKVQGPWQTWHFVMKIDGSVARNIDFEVANFQVQRKTPRKTSILKLQSVKIGGSLARNARFDAPTCLVSSLWFSCGLAVSMGEAAKPLLFQGFQAGCHVVLHGRRGTLIPTCLITCRKSFCVAGAILLCRFHKMSCSFRSRRSILASFVIILRSRRSTPDSTLHTAPLTLHTFHSTFDTLHSTLFPLHSTLYTLHFTLQTSKLDSLHSTLYTWHSTLYTQHFTLYTPHCTLHTLLHTLHSALYTPHFTLYTLHSTLYTPHFTLYAPHSTLHTLHFTLDTWHSTLYTP